AIGAASTKGSRGLMSPLLDSRRTEKSARRDSTPRRRAPFAVPMVRIRFPPAGSQVRTCLWREFAFLRRQAAVFRGCASRGERRGRQRRAGRGNIGPTGGNISVGPYSSTAARDVGSLTIAVVFEFGSGSGNTERGPLIVPGERQT